MRTSPAPIGYTFERQNVLADLQQVLANVTLVPGSTLYFSNLPFPYQFALTAWVDTNLSKYDLNNTTCPTNLVIPNAGIVEPPPDLSGLIVGATGAMGSTGPRGPQGAQGFPGSDGTKGATGLKGDHGVNGTMGATGSVGATGSTGPIGPQGPTGEQGQKGEDGKIGATGPGGPAGSISLVRPHCNWCNRFLDPYLSLGVLVWLAVLSFIFILYMIIHCFTHRHKGSHAEKHTGVSNIYAELEEGKTTF